MSKELKVRPVKQLGTMLEIYYEGGGEVPAALSGMYTSSSVAQQAINAYLSQRKEKPRGKRASSSTVQ